MNQFTKKTNILHFIYPFIPAIFAHLNHSKTQKQSMKGFEKYKHEPDHLIKIEQLSESFSSKQLECRSVKEHTSLMLTCVKSNIHQFQSKSNQSYIQVLAEIALIFQLECYLDPLQQFLERITARLAYIYHEECRRNYHIFLVSNAVFSLTYHAKVLLLRIFKEYDQRLYYQERYKDSQPYYGKKRYPWSEAAQLEHSKDIQAFQRQIHTVFQGSFLNVLAKCQYESKKSGKHRVVHQKQEQHCPNNSQKENSYLKQVHLDGQNNIFFQSNNQHSGVSSNPSKKIKVDYLIKPQY